MRPHAIRSYAQARPQHWKCYTYLNGPFYPCFVGAWPTLLIRMLFEINGDILLSFLCQDLTWLATRSGRFFRDLARSWRITQTLSTSATTNLMVSSTPEPCSMIDATEPTYMGYIHILISVSNPVVPDHKLQTGPQVLDILLPNTIIKIILKCQHHQPSSFMLGCIYFQKNIEIAQVNVCFFVMYVSIFIYQYEYVCNGACLNCDHWTLLVFISYRYSSLLSLP